MSKSIMKMNSWKKNVAILSALAAVTLPLAGCSMNQKVAMVDYQAVVMNHPDRKAATEEMMKTYGEIQQKAMEEQKDENANPEDRYKKAMEYQKTLRDKETELFTPIKDNVDKKLDEVMKEKGYTSVYAKGALVRGGDDITSDVLRKEGVSEDEIKSIVEASDAQMTGAAAAPMGGDR